MDRALSLGRRAIGTASPNPAVGAVVVREGEVVGEGWTQPPGCSHAEVMSLKEAGTKAIGATLYVSLEPCCHIGKTPPCTDIIIASGVRKVCISIQDPNPVVNGRGVRLLNEAGIETILGDGAKDACELTEAYRKFILTKRPFVTIKYAMSLDGKIATQTGESQWITGVDARDYVHRLRAESDAIMVGINTVIVDNPRLTARGEMLGVGVKQPLRVVVDSHSRIPLNAALLSEPGNVIIACVDGSGPILRSLKGTEVIAFPEMDGMVDLTTLFKFLGDRDITSILVEGGSILHGSLLDRDLVDKVIGFVAPVIIGGSAAPSPVAGLGAQGISDIVRLNYVQTKSFGCDIAVIGYPRRG